MALAGTRGDCATTRVGASTGVRVSRTATVVSSRDLLPRGGTATESGAECLVGATVSIKSGRSRSR